MQQVSVSTLLRYLKNRLDGDPNLQRILVSGEISNYHRHFSGHLYFTLKDEYAAISCVMFKSAAASLRFEPKTGDKVIVQANASIYETAGQLQLYVLKMTPEGYGDLYARYEALKEKLSKEGKFDQDHKIAMPTSYPERIAVLVGDKSAAMSDIRTAFARRWPLCKVDYYPVLVQGADAPSDIIPVLKQVDEMDYDGIILARGGGSFEDLFCFNDEELVNAIYSLKTFLITGIGHEQDFTLSDFAADQRAATPTAAAELITPDVRDVIIQIDSLQSDLRRYLNDAFDRKKMNFDHITSRLLKYQDRLLLLNERIDRNILNIRRLISRNIERYSGEVDRSLSVMRHDIDLKLNTASLSYKRFHTLLEAYNSQNVLKRGYTLVFQDGRIVRTKNELKQKPFRLRFIDGDVDAEERK